MRSILLAVVWGLLTVAPTLAQSFLLDSQGAKLLDDKGGFLLTTDIPGGKIHSVMQLATWGEPPNSITISLYLDVQPGKSAIKMMGFAQQDGTTISNTWFYLNGVIVAQCPSPPYPAGRCDYMLPVSLMSAGQNTILFAFQAPGTLAFGEKINISKP